MTDGSFYYKKACNRWWRAPTKVLGQFRQQVLVKHDVQHIHCHPWWVKFFSIRKKQQYLIHELISQRVIPVENLIQCSKFASAVGKCQGFCQGINLFYSICLGKKNAEAIELLEILNKYFSTNKKTYFIFNSF